jgi:uncharacterized surface protein with fasciclin (FAS1) repeats
MLSVDIAQQMNLTGKTYSLSLAVLFILMCGCTDIYDQEKFQRPEWLAGKLYTQIKTREDLTVFSRCLELTGYDTVLDLTGSFTVFAPTDEAFEAWFSGHPAYGNAVENIPYRELENLVRSHIIQNAWSKEQMQSLDIYGWIDRDDPNNDKPRGYKRQTILREPDRKYWVISDKQQYRIVDSTESNTYRKVYSVSRKYAPIFFEEYLSINDLNAGDYAFYFDRNFESGNIYYANARVSSPEIFAENGFVYEVDRVIGPLYNAEELLAIEYGGNRYGEFLSLIHRYPKFTFDDDATFAQAEAKAGGDFDTLYSLDYPDLDFNIHEELTGPNTDYPAYTVRYQNGLLAPTDLALQRLIDEVLTVNSGYPHWPNFNTVPDHIKKLIINAHMSRIPVYRTDIQEGFENGAGDIITLDEAAIEDKYYGSNCTFIGLNEAIIPRAFTSITGPVYLRPGYSTMMYAIEHAKTLSALKTPDVEYVLFAISDARMQMDSSLMIHWQDRDLNWYYFTSYNRSDERFQPVSRNELTKRILNQVATSLPKGLARREFIENLAGNFLVFDNEEQTVTGGLDNLWGYRGDSIIHAEARLLEEPLDNGLTYDFGAWFNTPTAGMYNRLSQYNAFMNLIRKAGLINEKLEEFLFLTEGEFYTIFLPSEDALAASGWDTLTIPALQQFIKYHFIKGSRIWTDGNAPGGDYETLRRDESSTQYVTRYSTLSLNTGYDYIDILYPDGTAYCHIPEDPDKTNIMIATRAVEESTATHDYHDYIITGVIHEIDSVLIRFTENQ